jgi:nucleoside-diphosphate-sugar epimerase
LILGSSGQIGSALVNFYKGEAITCDIVECDTHDLRIHENSVVREKMESCDFVHFMAFDVGGSRYLQKYQNTFEFIDNNMRLMQNTFSLIDEFKKPFIFASSQMSNMDYSSYGTLKRVGEWYTKILGGLNVKFWNVYGIEHDLEKSHVVTDFILKARNSGKIDMVTDGTEKRQFLYVEDCCEAIDVVRKMYDVLDRDRELHIASYKWNTVLDIAYEVVKQYPSEIIPGSSEDSVQKDMRNEPDPYILNFWKPKTSLEEGIRKICEYYGEG